jgi:thymidylate synthase (FAD)
MSQIKAELLDYMGTDLDVVNAARVSFSKESEWENEHWDHPDFEIPNYLKEADVKLINYLAKHDHWTPFAHTALKFRCSAPVPIRTQAFKHKIGMVENEESRRYISSTPEIYVPEFFRSKPEGSIKQGSGKEHIRSDDFMQLYEVTVSECVERYELMIEAGVCPEQARFILPQGAIVNWIWTGNLVSFANFYLKRTDPNAQYEVRVLAESVGKQIAEIFPVSWTALVKEK